MFKMTAGAGEMDEELRKKSCTDFAELLASTAPAPGGGGAAALMGALAASLGSMAAALTAGRKKYDDRREEMLSAVEQAADQRRMLLELIDRDAEGFRPLAAAYSLPKDSPHYAEIMRRATLQACQAPWEMLRTCQKTAELLETLAEKVSPLLLSDVGCGAAACRAAMEAAAMNVFVNTRTLKGDGEAAKLHRETQALLRTYSPRLQAVSEAVTARLCDTIL